MKTREELNQMTMKAIAEYAESVGISVNKKGSKAKAIDKILEEQVEKLVLTGEEEMVDCIQQETEQVVESEETEKPKKEKKEKAPKLTWDDIMKAIPETVEGLEYTHLKGDRVGITSNKRRLMAIGAGRGGYRIITNKADLANGFSDSISGLEWAMTADGRDFVFKKVTQEQMEQMVKYAVQVWYVLFGQKEEAAEEEAVEA